MGNENSSAKQAASDAANKAYVLFLAEQIWGLLQSSPGHDMAYVSADPEESPTGDQITVAISTGHGAVAMAEAVKGLIHAD